MSGKDSSNQIKQIENGSSNEAKNIAVESLPIQCKQIGLNFFNCVEEKVLILSSDISLNHASIETKMINEYVPECMVKFNLEECLQKYDPNI